MAVMSTAAPALAASSPACPDMPSGIAGQWTSTIPAAGTLSPAIPGNQTGWIDLEGDVWASQRDNGSTSTNQGVTTVVYTETSVPVVAGETYTFAFEVAGIWSSGDATPPDANRGRQYVRVLVDGADALRVSTRSAVDGGSQIPMSTTSLTWTQFSVTYTATESKNLAFAFFNVLSPRDTYLTNDDILIRLPEIICGPAGA